MALPALKPDRRFAPAAKARDDVFFLIQGGVYPVQSRNDLRTRLAKRGHKAQPIEDGIRMAEREMRTVLRAQDKEDGPDA